jgi:hypothetical protein
MIKSLIRGSLAAVQLTIILRLTCYPKLLAMCLNMQMYLTLTSYAREVCPVLLRE